MYQNDIVIMHENVLYLEPHDKMFRVKCHDICNFTLQSFLKKMCVCVYY